MFSMIAKTLSLTLGLFFLVGCSGPFMLLPGGALAGETAPFDPGALSEDIAVLQLETNPSDPYSVNLGFVRIGDELFLDPAVDRTWYQHIKTDPRVRVRFDGSALVHNMTAQEVTEPEILARFEPDRIVLRLNPGHSQ